ncbi:hypothetical protein ACFWBB_30305 [Streptomyces sp. NPDC060000]|uniref:hypothetical protein n=1 Tax=Streptomyces sp. NPDC060000 TaxID=3347031 RepID=UPI00367BB5CE
MDDQKADLPDRLSIERKVVDGIRIVTVRGEIDHDVKEASPCCPKTARGRRSGSWWTSAV